MEDLRRHAADERADLLALLEELTSEQWEAASLCPAWRVRDVAVHVFSYDELSRRDLIRRFIRGAVTPGGANAVGLADFADRTPADLLGRHASAAELLAHLGSGNGEGRHDRRPTSTTCGTLATTSPPSRARPCAS